jgi:hypothetical protein
VWHALSESGQTNETEHKRLIDELRANNGRLPMKEIEQVVYDGNRDRMNHGLGQAVARGLVRKEPRPEDRRAKLVVLIEPETTHEGDAQVA